MIEDFFRAVAPVLFANLLTLFLIWSLVSYSRMEASGELGTVAAGIRLGAIILVLGFALYGLHLYGFFTAR